MSRRTRLKSELREALREKNHVKIKKVIEEGNNVVSALLAILAEDDSEITPAACKALAGAAAHFEPRDREKTREILNRINWFMLDRSGLKVPGAPEAMVEALLAVPSFAEEFSGVIFCFITEEFFVHSVLRGAYKMAERYPDLIRPYMGDIRKEVDNPDPEVQALAKRVLDVLEAGTDTAG